MKISSFALSLSVAQSKFLLFTRKKNDDEFNVFMLNLFLNDNLDDDDDDVWSR